MAKVICIIGGSGFVGRSVVRQALAEGYAVRVACRHPEKARAMLVEGASLHKVDIVDGHGLDAAVDGVDYVINLVGLLLERGRYSFDAAHVRGTEHILAACQQANVRRYVHMSALGSTAGSDSAYGRSKYEAEQRVRAADLDWTIMRPSIIYGADDSFFNKFDQLTTFAPVFPVIAGATLFQPVWVEDVARAFVLALEDQTTFSQCYDLGGPHRYRFSELLRLMLEVKGRNRLLIPLPHVAASLMATLMQFLPVPPLTPDQLLMLQQDNVVEGEGSFPVAFGVASTVEQILPTYINGKRVGRSQDSMNACRENYRKH